MLENVYIILNILKEKVSLFFPKTVTLKIDHQETRIGCVTFHQGFHQPEFHKSHFNNTIQENSNTTFTVKRVL